MNIFRKLRILKENFKKEKEIMKGTIYSNFIYCNNHVDIIYTACKECYKGKLNDDFEGKLKYIGDKVNLGHESVLEHSNIVTYYEFSKEYINELTEVLTVCKYVYPKIKMENGKIHFIIAGSIRGYKYIIRNINNYDNRIMKEILNQMYNLYSCYFIDFIKDNIMDQDRFIDIEDCTSLISYNYNYNNSEKIDYINYDNISLIYNKCKNIISNDDILDMATVTIYFKDVSRIITQQFTRHRNAISQASQRYIDETNGVFNNPAEFKDIYNKDREYTINIKGNNIANPIPLTFTLQDLGNLELNIYKTLRSEGLLKEDARAYLPNNISSSLYVTFTLRNLIWFLYLRDDKHAQAENRLLAHKVFEYTENILDKYKDIITEDMFSYIMPNYKKDLISSESYYDDIDEIID